MKTYRRKRSLPAFILLLILYSGSVCAETEVYLINNDYLAGFVRSEDGEGVEDATIVVTDSRNKIFSLRSAQGGWFESSTPISRSTQSDSFNIFVMKRGYKPAKEKIIITRDYTQDTTRILNIKLKPVPDFYFESGTRDHQLKVLYGYVYDKKINSPIRGAVITINKGESPIGSAVTRDSGFFSLYYEMEKKEAGIDIQHRDYTAVKNTITLSSDSPYYEISMPKLSHYFSLGLGVALQYTGDTADLETGMPFSINLAWYPDGLLILNEDTRRHKMNSGFINGYEISIGVLPYLEKKRGADEVRSIYVLGLGIVHDAVDYYSFPIQTRAGLSLTDTGKGGIYFGLSIPFYFFGS